MSCVWFRYCRLCDFSLYVWNVSLEHCAVVRVLGFPGGFVKDFCGLINELGLPIVMDF